MDDKTSTQIARDIMADFARLTGLEPASKTPRRYLWTDAFAVCNFLELWHRTGVEKYKDLALNLIDQVHKVLEGIVTTIFAKAGLAGSMRMKAENIPPEVA